MSQHTTSLVGHVIAKKYHLEKRLASGGMGEVYLAQHISLGEPRAIKVIRDAQLQHPTAHKRFLREIETTHKVSRSNPHIVLIYDDYGFEANFGYYVMEYIDGTPLTAYIHREPGRLPVPWCLSIAQDICEAMEMVHQAGILHRDLKPDNLLLTMFQHQPDFVKIVDFGMAQNLSIESRITIPGAMPGTVFYAAPEQFGLTESMQPRLPNADARSDIYSLGCVLFEMLTGRTPFLPEASVSEGDGTYRARFELLLQHLTTMPPSICDFRDDLPAGLDDVVSRALEKDPAQRFQGMAAFAHALAAVQWDSDPRSSSFQSLERTGMPLAMTDPNLPPLMLAAREPVQSHSLSSNTYTSLSGTSDGQTEPDVKAVSPFDAPTLRDTVSGFLPLADTDSTPPSAPSPPMATQEHEPVDSAERTIDLSLPLTDDGDKEKIS